MNDLMPADAAAFDDAWHTRWPDARPVGYELRDAAAGSWVRFHSLPESKRYAETDAERAEVLRRHLVVLRELCDAASADPADLRVVTATFSESAEQQSYWQSVRLDLDDPESWWAHLRVRRTGLESAELRALLRRVADDEAQGVIIAPPDAAWLYHPYDGGADVIAPDAHLRDELKRDHADWLSSHPLGL
ncbi:MAG: hypothetical protein QM728_05425 [Gordonia sp. (in: high G+C Gram-positive bacteria)]|uniref:DUF3885 domain-containing protein n=1 Tax=Gordonia sp. (in: high G+C Gram-positive bacteria) TaxID=84139 RepID=UPI0039E6B80C